MGEVAAADPAVVAGVISDQRTEHNIPHTVSCHALGVSESWFYKWRKAEPTGRELRRSQLEEAIGQIHRLMQDGPQPLHRLACHGLPAQFSATATIAHTTVITAAHSITARPRPSAASPTGQTNADAELSGCGPACPTTESPLPRPGLSACRSSAHNTQSSPPCTGASSQYTHADNPEAISPWEPSMPHQRPGARDRNATEQ
ncbi:hypothetical protein [Streptomyces sp. NPDC002994]|uniref:hypothetical protein n=1 Tax=Streptomyces sp. NPDC002994 TaxID=3154441 RepID=UPI00339F103A